MGSSASSAFRRQKRAQLQAIARFAWLRNDVSANQVHVAFDLETPDHVGECKDVIIDDERIQKMIADLKPGELFCDPDFPADNSILKSTNKYEITWVRPKDLVENPVLLLDGISRHDIIQGNLGTCSFHASCAAVARRSDIMERVIPPNQELYGPGHNGLVQFRFWKLGKWVKVHIDDRLPVNKGKHIIYARCTDPREFWVALLEKAYAKLHGSYASIVSGCSADCLVDLTGGFAKNYDVGNSMQNYDVGNSIQRKMTFRHLLRVFHADAFITCSIQHWKPSFSCTNGLRAKHIYTVSSVAEIQLKNGTKEKLVRLRNPWGELEWTGRWSDKSKAWETVDDETKAKLNYVQKEDGEFWMSFVDFCRRFDRVCICTLVPDFDEDGVDDKADQVKAIHGCWQLGKTCGGSRKDIVKFAINPQYLLILNTPEEPSSGPDAISGPDTRSSSAIQKCSVVITLMQEYLRSELLKGTKRLQIGFRLYKTPDPFHRLTSEHFKHHCDHGSSGTYINYREIFGRFELKPGCYVIVPATFEPDCAGNFMIRVYAANNFELRELPS